MHAIARITINQASPAQKPIHSQLVVVIVAMAVVIMASMIMGMIVVMAMTIVVV